MEADFNRKGTSIYADSIGKPIAKPFVNIVDARHAGSTRAAPSTSTDEGKRPGATTLVEGGIISRATSRFGSRPSTTAWRPRQRPPAELKFAPLPRMRATYML
jgi:TldD protein